MTEPLTDRLMFLTAQCDGCREPKRMQAALVEAVEEIKRLKVSFSDGMPKWRDADNDPPADGQKVLGCWVGPSVVNEGMEPLTYHAADAPDSHERWYDVFGMESDPPTHWMPLPEAPK